MATTPPTTRGAPATATQWGSPGSQAGMLSWLAEHLDPGVILNLGAGPRAPERADCTFIGVDLVAPTSPTAAPFVIADAGAIPLHDESCQGALLKDIVEHTLDPIAVLRETHRVCRPGARLVLTVPRAIPRAVWADPTHIRGFTRNALTTLLAYGGWQPDHAPLRMGGFPGAGRLGLEPHLLTLMKIPGLGHRFGTNWFVTATRGAVPGGSVLVT